MEVGIQETEHYEGVFPVIQLFDQPGYTITLFVDAKIEKNLRDLLAEKADRYRWIVKEKQESTFSFCRRINRAIQAHQITLLYLNTVSKHHIAYAWLLGQQPLLKSILTVHDVNCLFKDKPGVSLRSWIKYWGKKLLTKRAGAFNTVSDTVVPYLSAQAGDRAVYSIPGAVHQPRNNTSPYSAALRLVIPGTIDEKRRDYTQVFQLLDKSKAYAVVLLGGGNAEYAKDIWNTCKLHYAEQTEWFEEQEVRQAVFDAALDRAHFIWIPSVVNTKICGDIAEVYGLTKSSGNIFDIIKHGKPFLYPESLVIPAALKPAGLQYANMDALLQKLQALNSETYAQLDAAAKIAAGQYSIELIRQRFPAVFGTGLSPG